MRSRTINYIISKFKFFMPHFYKSKFSPFLTGGYNKLSLTLTLEVCILKHIWRISSFTHH